VERLFATLHGVCGDDDDDTETDFVQQAELRRLFVADLVDLSGGVEFMEYCAALFAARSEGSGLGGRGAATDIQSSGGSRRAEGADLDLAGVDAAAKVLASAMLRHGLTSRRDRGALRRFISLRSLDDDGGDGGNDQGGGGVGALFVSKTLARMARDRARRLRDTAANAAAGMASPEDMLFAVAEGRVLRELTAFASSRGLVPLGSPQYEPSSPPSSTLANYSDESQRRMRIAPIWLGFCVRNPWRVASLLAGLVPSERQLFCTAHASKMASARRASASCPTTTLRCSALLYDDYADNSDRYEDNHPGTNGDSENKIDEGRIAEEAVELARRCLREERRRPRGPPDLDSTQRIQRLILYASALQGVSPTPVDESPRL
jgi:hypothetical protein